MTDRWPADPVARAAEVAAWGLRVTGARDPSGVAALVDGDPDPRVRAAALGALVRGDGWAAVGAAWRTAMADPDAAVRARACELAPVVLGGPRGGGAGDPGAAGPGGGTEAEGKGAVMEREMSNAVPVLRALADSVGLVAEAAAFALGELGAAAVAAGAVAALAGVATDHGDPLVREAAVAALGSLGDPGGLAAVLAACGDKPAVRRRAVLALAAFEGAEVEVALARALSDRDWQVRQAAEDLVGPPERGGTSKAR